MSDSGQRGRAPGAGGRSDFLPATALLGGLILVFALGRLDSPSPAVALLAAIGGGLAVLVLALSGWTLAARLAAPQRGCARAALLVVLAHLLLMVGHDAAHDRLAVELGGAQVAYLVATGFVAPIVAAALLYSRWARAGALLLAAAMAGALLFGVAWHYVLVSPDHVAHLPAGGAQGLFRWTAAGLAATEALGVLAGLVSWRRLRAAGAP